MKGGSPQQREQSAEIGVGRDHRTIFRLSPARTSSSAAACGPKTLSDICRLQVRIIGQNLLLGPAPGEQTENGRHWVSNPRTQGTPPILTGSIDIRSNGFNEARADHRCK
jgi:hypothetical protein